MACMEACYACWAAYDYRDRREGNYALYHRDSLFKKLDAIQTFLKE